MYFITNLKLALANFNSAKLRMLLAMLGILVGTASVVALVSCANLATAQALRQIENLGTHLLAISFYENTANGSTNNTTLTTQQTLAAKNSSPAIAMIAPYTNLYLPISYQGHILNANIVGTTQELQVILNINIMQGRFISFLDHYAYYCVIGSDIYQALLNISAQNPIGQQITLGNSVFTIIGVTPSTNNNDFFNANLNQAIYIPIDTSFVLSQYTEINNVLLQLKPNANITLTETQLQHYFNKIIPDKQLFFRSAQALLQSMQNQRQILTVLLGLIGSISLIVGGIGIMNVMLISVVERRREIGIRRALGATKTDIKLMFLTEAIILTLSGGIIGVVLGIMIALLVADYAHWQFAIYPLPAIVGFMVSLLVGLFFGLYPAQQAAKLDPITCLHAE